MSRLHMLIIAVFTVALGTGFVVGMGVNRPSLAPKEGGRSWLADKLQLSPDQGEKIKAVWSDNLQHSFKHRSDAVRQYRKERDDALIALLTPDQKSAYEKILNHYNDQMTELSHEQDAQFQAAAQKTKELLDDHQRQIYDDLLKKGFRGGPFGPRDGGPPGGHPDGGRDGHEGRPWHTSPATTSQPGAL